MCLYMYQENGGEKGVVMHFGVNKIEDYVDINSKFGHIYFGNNYLTKTWEGLVYLGNRNVRLLLSV